MSSELALSPAMQDFCDSYRRYSLTSEPIIAIATPDYRSTISTLTASSFSRKKDKDAGAVTVKNWPIFSWHFSNGLTAENDEAKEWLATYLENEFKEELAGNYAPRTPEDRANLLEQKRKMKTQLPANCLEVAIQFPAYARLFFCLSSLFLDPRDNKDVIAAIDYCRQPFSAGETFRMLILMSEEIDLPTIFSDVPVLDEPYPKADELKKFVKSMHEDNNVEAPSEEFLGRHADALLGLSTRTAKSVIAFNLFSKEARKSPLAFARALGKSKRDVLNKIPGLSVWNGTQTFDDVGGLRGIKAEFDSLMSGTPRPSAFVLLDEMDKQFVASDTSGVSQKQNSILLSWLADNNIKGYIFFGLPGGGKSESVKAMGGTYGVDVITFSLAKMQASYVGDSEKMLSRALKAIGSLTDNRGVFIATCNNMSTFPPELVRRFSSGVFFFDLANKEEREAIWKVKRKSFKISDGDATPNDNGWTGAEIHRCAERAAGRRITLSEAAKSIVPMSLSARPIIEKMRQDADGNYASAVEPNTPYKWTAIKDGKGGNSGNNNDNITVKKAGRAVAIDDS